MFVLAVTDPRWYEFLLDRPQAEPINFWTPTPWRPRIPAGTTFGFMVKSPFRKIGGYGRFVRYEETSVDEAWFRYRTANGVPDRTTFHSRIVQFAGRRSSGFIDRGNPTIGCIVLDECVLLPREQMVAPVDLGLSFPDQIVKWKSFEGTLNLPEAAGLVSTADEFSLVDPRDSDWESRKVKKRISQGAFRDRILAAYGGRCAISGETCSTILEAAHIQPFVSMASNHVQNGLSLRRDFHRLFDTGLLSLNDNYEVMVSGAVESPTVRTWAGRRIHIPNDPTRHPSVTALDYHRREVYRA